MSHQVNKPGSHLGREIDFLSSKSQKVSQADLIKLTSISTKDFLSSISDNYAHVLTTQIVKRSGQYICPEFTTELEIGYWIGKVTQTCKCYNLKSSPTCIA